MPHFPRPIAAAVALAMLMPLAACAAAASNTRRHPLCRPRRRHALQSSPRQRLDQGNYAAAAAVRRGRAPASLFDLGAPRAADERVQLLCRPRIIPKAIDSAQRFLSIHPGNRDAPYAYYLVALELLRADRRRRPATRRSTQQALDALGELIRRYPDTRYAADARLKIDLVNDHLAGKEMEIGRFYQRAAQWLAATIRFRTVDRQVSDDQPHARGAGAADRMLSRARRPERGAEGGGGARRQLSRLQMVSARLCADAAASAGDKATPAPAAAAPHA